MQKWSPEPFAVERPVPSEPTLPPGDFAALVDGTGREESERLFRREAGFADSRSLMGSLTQEERAQVYELVEMDLDEEYSAREAELKAELEAQLAAAREENAARVDAWSRAIAAAVAADLQEAAAASARLAVDIAGKIVRAHVATDPAAIARAIETTLFKVTTSAPLTVRVHPDEADWLDGRDEVRERLHIGEIVADRRVEAGGCIVSAAGREWDATLQRQLDTIAELVADAVAVAAGRPTELPSAPPAGALPEDATADGATGDPEGGDEPGLD